MLYFFNDTIFNNRDLEANFLLKSKTFKKKRKNEEKIQSHTLLSYFLLRRLVGENSDSLLN